MQLAQEYKAMVTKRDAENARLREQREQLSAELTERRQKDSVKLASYQEYRALIDTNTVSHRYILGNSSFTRYLGKDQHLTIRSKALQGPTCRYCEC